MFCKKCGAQNDNHANFCEKCGEKLGKEVNIEQAADAESSGSHKLSPNFAEST